jgi:hypothetical protein
MATFAREAAAALLRWSRVADPEQAAGLLQKAADIRDRLGELPVPEADISPLAPDVQSERLRER